MLTAQKHFLTALQVTSQDDLTALFTTAKLLTPVANGTHITNILNGAVIASLFFEPSTRTRLSFETAALRLGAKTITVTGTDNVSITKGETYFDTARVISGYADCAVLRTNAPEITNDYVAGSTIPVLNAGSGADEHPTQALLDVYTAHAELENRGKTLNGATITMLGDLKHGRTVHSLIKLLRLYPNITLHLVAPAGLECPTNVIDIAKSAGHTVHVHTPETAYDAYKQSDVIYATRLQKERLSGDAANAAYPTQLRLDTDTLNAHAKPDVIILHPLPRDGREGSNDLPIPANDTRLCAFTQAHNGVPIRMALITRVFNLSDAQLTASITLPSWKST